MDIFGTIFSILWQGFLTLLSAAVIVGIITLLMMWVDVKGERWIMMPGKMGWIGRHSVQIVAGMILIALIGGLLVARSIGQDYVIEGPVNRVEWWDGTTPGTCTFRIFDSEGVHYDVLVRGGHPYSYAVAKTDTTEYYHTLLEVTERLQGVPGDSVLGIYSLLTVDFHYYPSDTTWKSVEGSTP